MWWLHLIRQIFSGRCQFQKSPRFQKPASLWVQGWWTQFERSTSAASRTTPTSTTSRTRSARSAVSPKSGSPRGHRDSLSWRWKRSGTLKTPAGSWTVRESAETGLVYFYWGHIDNCGNRVEVKMYKGGASRGRSRSRSPRGGRSPPRRRSRWDGSF